MEKTGTKSVLFDVSGIKEMLALLLKSPDGVKKNDFRTKLDLSSNTAIENREKMIQLDLIKPKQEDASLYVLTERGRMAAEIVNGIEEKGVNLQNLSGYGITASLHYFTQHPEGCIKNNLRTDLGLAPNTVESIILKFGETQLISFEQDTEKNTAGIFKITPLGQEVWEKITIFNSLVNENDPIVSAAKSAAMQKDVQTPGNPIIPPIIAKSDSTCPEIVLSTVDFYQLTQRVSPPIINYRITYSPSKAIYLPGEIRNSYDGKNLVNSSILRKRMQNTNVRPRDEDYKFKNSTEISKIADTMYTYFFNYNGTCYATICNEIDGWDRFSEIAREIELMHFKHYDKYTEAQQIGQFGDEEEYDTFMNNWTENKSYTESNISGSEQICYYSDFLKYRDQFPTIGILHEAWRYGTDNCQEFKEFYPSSFREMDTMYGNSSETRKRYRSPQSQLEAFREARSKGFTADEARQYVEVQIIGNTNPDEYRKFWNSGYIPIVPSLKENNNPSIEKDYFDKLKRAFESYKLMKTAGFQEREDWIQAKTLKITDPAEYKKFKDADFFDRARYHLNSKHIGDEEVRQSVILYDEREYYDALMEAYESYKEMRKSGFTKKDDWQRAQKSGFDNPKEFKDFLRSGAKSREEFIQQNVLPEKMEEVTKTLKSLEKDWKKYETAKDWTIAFQKAWTYTENLFKKQLIGANQLDFLDQGNESILLLLERSEELIIVDQNQLHEYRKKRNLVVHKNETLTEAYYEKAKAFLSVLNEKILKCSQEEWDKLSDEFLEEEEDDEEYDDADDGDADYDDEDYDDSSDDDN